MSRNATYLLIVTLVLIIAQVVVFNHVCLFNIAVPFAFLFILIRLPLNISQNMSLTIGFLLGLVIDIFSDTHGMNALACTICTAIRKPVLRLYFPREDELSDPYPSISSLGLATYSKYVISMSFIYCLIIFTIEAFSFFNIAVLILRILASTIVTSLIIIGIDSLTLRKHEKRL